MSRFVCFLCFNPLNLTILNSNCPSVTSNTTINPIRSYIFSCKHTFCQNCKDKCKGKCVLCKRYCNILEINSSMPQHLRLYFEPLSRSFHQMMAIWKFQCQQDETHTQHLYKAQQEYLKKLEQDKVKYVQQQKDLNQLKERGRQIRLIYHKLAKR